MNDNDFQDSEPFASPEIDSWDDDENDDYYGFYTSDEWDYEDEEPDYDFHQWLCKAPNGHLYLEQVTLVRYPHQDWGECETYSEKYKLNQLSDERKARVIEYGKTMEAGSAVPLGEALADGDDDDDFYETYDDNWDTE